MRTLKIGGVPEHFNLPWYLGIEQGYFQDGGVDLNWTDQPGGTGQLTRGLNNGELDLAVLLTEGMVADILKGGKGRILQFHVETPLRWGIHVPAESSFEKVGDLEGKRFAITRYGSGSHLMAHINADRMGWDPDQLEWVVVGGLDGARKALASREADAFMCEQFFTQFLVEKGEFRRVGSCDTPWPSFLVAGRDDVVQEEPETIARVLSVITRTNKEFMERQDAVDIVTNRFDITEKDAREWFEMTRWATTSRVDEETLYKVQRTLRNLKLVPSTINSRDLMANENVFPST